MKQKSIQTNYILNLSRVVFSIISGFVIMPYINRVIGLEGVGKIEYVNSIITYFVLFSGLGIPMYGVREIAKKRDDLEAKSKFMIEIIIILFITTLISYLILFCFILRIDNLKDLKTLIIFMSSMVFLSNIGVEWFYQGIEDQKFITIRFFVVKIISLFLIFYLVKSPNDYVKYGFIIVLSSVGGNIFNALNLKNHINFKKINYSKLNIKSHLKPILTIFIASVSVSIYIQLDNLILGTLKGSNEVGYYAMANKLIRFVILIITTLGSVLLPRLSYLVNNDFILYQSYLKKSLNCFLIIAFPFTILFLLLAKDFTNIVGGNEFLESIVTMQILSPIILLVSIAYFLGYIILYPLGKENIYTIAVIISALFSVVANLYFTPKHGHVSVAVIAVISELLGVLVMIIMCLKTLKKIQLIDYKLLYYSLSSLIMSFVILFISNFELNSINNLIISTSSGLIVYILTLVLLKEEIVSSKINDIKSYLKNRN